MYTGRVNAELEAKLKTLPRSPGVYFHKSKTGEVIYVGKAAVLKNRVRQYFQDSRSRDSKTMALVAEIADTDWVETESEIDALFLESEMVKRYMPRYNVLLRDDKSQSYVRIDMKREWPVVSFTRNPADDGAEYYGPFYNGFALKKALRYLRRVFPYLIKPLEATTSKLEAQIGLNPRLEEGSDAYKATLRKLISYIKGNRVALTREIEQEMKRAANEQQFEAAARLRNRLRAMQELQRRVMFGDREFLDISKDQALSDLADLLGLPDVPRRIEGYDISHQSGQDVVASMVVFTNGASDRSEYRKFKMTRQTNDDTGNIYETLYRRLSPQHLKRWGEPSLLLIDGGKTQLAAAIRAQEERGTSYPVISIAKRDEELVVAPGSHIDLERLRARHLPAGTSLLRDGDYLVLNLHVGQRKASGHSKNFRAHADEVADRASGGGRAVMDLLHGSPGGASPSLSKYTDIIKLIQRIRDESHRFAVSYHSSLKRTRQTTSLLEGIPGIGPKTRQLLLRKFGSVRGILAASEADIAAHVGASKARVVRRHLDAAEH